MGAYFPPSGIPSNLQDFNEWLQTQPHKHKVVISGNHDYCLEPGERDKNQALLSNATHYLEDSGIIIEGKLFGFSELTERYQILGDSLAYSPKLDH